MQKIDRRKSYYIMLDTETANIQKKGSSLDISSALVYDIGIAVMDKKGNIYETYSYIIKEVFYNMSDIMQSAHYSEKIPQYKQGIKEGQYKTVSYLTAYETIRNLVEKYNIKAIVAHNMIFDYTALNATIRYLTQSRYRYFLPYGIELWDTLRMAESTICKQPTYKKFCETNGYLTKQNRVRKTVEILYRYITDNTDFISSHTGLSDVIMEKEIFTRCIRQKKKIRKLAFMPRATI